MTNILEGLKEGKVDIEEMAIKTLPFRYKISNKLLEMAIGTAIYLIKDILDKSHSLKDIGEEYETRVWTKEERRYRPRLNALLNILKKEGIK